MRTPEQNHPIIDLPITDVAFGGKGVARHEGKVYFIPFVIPGERVRARVVRDKKKFAEAELLEVLEPSPDRVEPPCPYFGQCGGCAYQHLAYPAQLAIKQRQVEQTLRRVGRLEEVPMRPIVPSPAEYGYRNRIRVHVEGGCTGFFAHGSHNLVDIEQCIISVPAVNESLHDLRQSSVPVGDYTLTARGRGEFFEQTNTEVAIAMVEAVRACVSEGRQLVVDAYCGAGFFARRLVDKAERIVGIEENQYAVEYAKRTAGEREQYVGGDVAVHLGEVLAGAESARTTVVLDPPAAGISPRVGDLLLGNPPAEIVYVSCDPATLARDLGLLCRSTYRLESVTPLDMFPQTAEVEVVAHMVRR